MLFRSEEGERREIVRRETVRERDRERERQKRETIPIIKEEESSVTQGDRAVH